MRDSGYLKESEEIIQKLRSLPVLDSFNDEDLRGIVKLSRMIQYEPGEQIIQEGQTDNWIYFLVKGKVGIQKQGQTITILRRIGDIFGEMGIIDGSPRSASIIAIDETACLAMDASFLDKLKGGEKTAFTSILFRIFAEIMANRLRIADEELVKVKDENEMLRAEVKKLKSTIRT